MHDNKTSLPLPVLAIGGALVGFLAAYLITHVLVGIMWIAAPIVGALWGLSYYKKPLK